MAGCYTSNTKIQIQGIEDPCDSLLRLLTETAYRLNNSLKYGFDFIGFFILRLEVAPDDDLCYNPGRDQLNTS